MLDNTKTTQIFSLHCPYDNDCQGTSRRILFVCSAGMLRSATAAYVGALMGYNTRACGSESYALVPLSANLIYWAHSIFFVNRYNYHSAMENFEHDEELITQLKQKSTVCDIEDIYDYRSPKLIKIIEELLS